MNEIAKPESYGALGPAMQAIPERWRDFVRYLVLFRATIVAKNGRRGHGAIAMAYRKAGFGKGSEKYVQARNAHDLSRDERILAAVAEESQKMLRLGHPEAVGAALEMIRDPLHKDHARAVAMVLDRVDPITTKHDIHVTRRTIDPDQEALEELAALRKLGTSREKLLELFGGNGLDRLEQLEARQLAQRVAAAKVIDGETIEVSNE